ncbi:MAG: HIT domain-containing protein [Chloroflexi bacterium]|nr:HIT domain-containing protein [Chloroflexota bacterium]
MERLWTPWRRAFIESAARPEAKPPSCFLCANPAAGIERDRVHFILYRGERTYALLNLYPYNSGHLLVAPYQHTGNFAHLDPATSAEMAALAQRCVAALTEVYRPHAFNLGMNLGEAAGAGVPDHLHTHVVPRWNGDTNFMPVLGSTKVLPESLEQTFDRLRPHFQAGP